MMALRTVSEYEEMRRRRQAAVYLATQRLWSQMGDDLDASWARISRRIGSLVTAAQYGAAEEALAYVPAVLAEQGVDSPALADVDPGAVSGVATSTDGLAYGSLDNLLYGSVIHAKTGPAESLSERLDIGGKHLSSLIFTQVADAGRMAATTDLAVRPQAGWVRQVNPPCCKRCAVLAGKWFRYNQGFDRHPGCDCTHIPAAEDTPDHPGTHIEAEDVKDLTEAERKAIAVGADMNQVINASRKGSLTPSGRWTREGTTKGGWYAHIQREIAKQEGRSLEYRTTSTGRRGAVANYKVRRVAPRATPQAIVDMSTSDEDMYRNLARSGYITGASIPEIARRARGL